MISRACVAVLVAGTLAGCATDDPNKRSKTGALIGAVAGAVVGHQVDGDKGRYAGAVVGALAGAAAGNYMDKQAAELERQLAAEQARDELRITRMSGNALRVGIASDASFEFGKADLRTQARTTYRLLALADQAMFQAKSSGRDRVVTVDETFDLDGDLDGDVEAELEEVSADAGEPVAETPLAP